MVLSLGLPLTPDTHAHGRMYYSLYIIICIHTGLPTTICECVAYVHIRAKWNLEFCTDLLQGQYYVPTCFYFEIIIMNNDYDKDVHHYGICPLTAYAIWVIF